MCFQILDEEKRMNIYRGGGTGGVGPPLELEIYLVNFFENSQKIFLLVLDPLDKNRSSAPVIYGSNYFYFICHYAFQLPSV